MTLKVFSARIGYHDPDVLDVTRKSGRDGLFLAPSWDILKPALDARKRAAALLEETLGLDATARATAEQWEDDAWDVYRRAYRVELRKSYVDHRAKWDALLARPRVVLVCYCVLRPSEPLRCHRAILRTHILPACGAVDCGEIWT